ncbi:hypothetical protein Ciccas_012519, partial [Cichlidogyrus casuarinus]
ILAKVYMNSMVVSVLCVPAIIICICHLYIVWKIRQASASKIRTSSCSSKRVSSTEEELPLKNRSLSSNSYQKGKAQHIRFAENVACNSVEKRKNTINRAKIKTVKMSFVIVLSEIDSLIF